MRVRLRWPARRQTPVRCRAACGVLLGRHVPRFSVGFVLLGPRTPSTPAVRAPSLVQCTNEGKLMRFDPTLWRLISTAGGGWSHANSIYAPTGMSSQL
jgi:hypothetical protein